MTSTAASPLTPTFPSKLPQVGTTIFSVMSALAAEHDAVNLGQGFPDFECDPALVDAVTQAMKAGHNQYPPMPGIPALREAVASKIEATYGRKYCANTEITITAGATQAILTAILAIVHAGDEVIVLDPCYDSYAPQHRTGRWHCCAGPPYPRNVSPRLFSNWRGNHATNPRPHHQQSAQP